MYVCSCGPSVCASIKAFVYLSTFQCVSEHWIYIIVLCVCLCDSYITIFACVSVYLSHVCEQDNIGELDSDRQEELKRARTLEEEEEERGRKSALLFGSEDTFDLIASLEEKVSVLCPVLLILLLGMLLLYLLVIQIKLISLLIINNYCFLIIGNPLTLSNFVMFS